MSIALDQFNNASGAAVNLSPTNSGLPSNALIQPSEAIYFLTPDTFKLRTTDKPGWNFGVRRTSQWNNVSVDTIFMRLATNLYTVQPRQNAMAFGFTAIG